VHQIKADLTVSSPGRINRIRNELNTQPHRRCNIITGEWGMVSPHGTKRPWQEEYRALGSLQEINHMQIFVNKGAITGCSNPHSNEPCQEPNAKAYRKQQCALI